MRDLTPEEQCVIDALGDAASAYVALPELHASDHPEFVQAIHAAQNIVYARPAFEDAKKSWEGR